MPINAISISAQRQPATPMDCALPQALPHTHGTTRPLAAMTGCCNRTGETPVAALAPSICKKIFPGRQFAGGPVFTPETGRIGANLAGNLLFRENKEYLNS
jgi:hypothetical protein